MKTNLLTTNRPSNQSAVPAGFNQPSLPAVTHCRIYALFVAMLVFGATQLQASDPVGVFASIDKVVLEPNDSSPERIQIWGAFAMADSKDRDRYQSPKSGYLYYKLPAEKADVARKEWADLKAVAGKREVIGFGARYGANGKIRQTDQKPTDPDTYPLGWGLTRMKDRQSNYPPIQQLLALQPKKSAETKKQ